MEIDLAKYSNEIVDFLSVETLEKIDYGVLDLSGIEDFELKKVLCYYFELLEMELRYNYLKNSTGIFRVSVSNGKYYYCEFDSVLEADSIFDLLMGEDVEPRRKFIEDNALSVINLDV